MKFSLPIKSTYVPNWGLFEALREILQNGKDQEDESGHEMIVRYKAGWLHVENIGAEMDKKALLIGHSTKTHRADLRGQFGEGLDLAMLAAVRAGHEMEITTGYEKWVPEVSYSKEFDEECLTVNVRRLRVRRDRVAVMLKVDKEKWEEVKPRFLFLDDSKAESFVCVPGGRLLTDPTLKGKVFVKGIFVEHLTDLAFGYDLETAELDRDRRMVGAWDLKWKLAGMWTHAVAAESARFRSKAYELLENESLETSELGSSKTYTEADGQCYEAIVDEFVTRHGADAIPVASMAESREAAHFGKKGVAVPKALRTVLLQRLSSLDKVREEFRTAVEKTYSWSDLDPVEQDVLGTASLYIDSAVGDLFEGKLEYESVMTFMTIVDFKSDGLLGLCEGTGIKVSRKQIGSLPTAFRVIIHELAHYLTKASDGEYEHIGMVEILWMKLSESLVK